MSYAIKMTTEEYMEYPSREELNNAGHYGACRYGDIVMGNALLMVYNAKKTPNERDAVFGGVSISVSLQKVEITDWWIHGTD